ncbi:aldehyde ferredoxin oxidoreductase family protein [Desulfitibacter alkalitolerans]|uniref:aldehyde ferredoxin oxidoreductase family protein n=1 Tax=Desulfitibacter alkalitolerans TaxID=264641 RepID=UPI0004897EF7|nr:aldehyde ferredoxin oxidoreductase C-terminal domain-containing protein [Desulfitibacter alkalitolerans]
MDKILRVNMTNQKVSLEDVLEKYQKLGGRALTSQIVCDEVPASCDPLGSENKVIIAPGLLGGTNVPLSGRISIGAKSPLTGTIKESNAGGVTGHKLAKIGLKAIIVEGQAQKGLYILVIDGQKGILVSADELASLGNYELVNKLREKYGSSSGYITVGPAGELGLRTACIANTDPDCRPSRVNGRGGLGAVMGTKGLKAIVILNSDLNFISYYDKEKFFEESKQVVQFIKEHPSISVYRDYGTAALVNITNNMGCLPTRNFSNGQFEGADNISGETMFELIKSRGGQGRTSHRCMPGCIVGCSNIYPDASGNELVAPLEYETIGLMGSNLGIDNLDTIAKLNYLCNDIGIDTIETGAAVGVAMEAGILPFGDGVKTIELVESIRDNTILGRLIGNGTLITGRVLGVKRIPTVKGQALAAYDPRGLKGLGVTYSTTPMGADHTAGSTLRAQVDHRKPDGQAQASRKSQRTMTLFDSLGMCMFTMPSLGIHIQTLANLVNARYGLTLNESSLIQLSIDTITAERNFNSNAGFRNIDDRLPEFMYKEKLPSADTVFDVPDHELDWVHGSEE